jgi:glycosyltransferase involved in cell wall biosynthesis
MDTKARPDIQVVMPAHNEADCVESVITEIYEELAQRLRVEFIVCEDGSADGTKEILRDLSQRIPMRLIMGDERKGYSRALIDGLKASTADFVLCLESDGQYSPSDFWEFHRNREDYDISIGWRKPRMDTFARKLMSASFGCVFRALFCCPLHDPSCAFMLIKRQVIAGMIEEMGLLMEGFQREFIAHAQTEGLRIREIPVRHRHRRSGGTKAFPLTRIPRAAASNLAGLLRLWWRIRTKSARPSLRPVKEPLPGAEVGVGHV